MPKNKFNTALKNFCLKEGADLFGVADIASVKKEFVLSKATIENMDRAVCLGSSLSAAVLAEIDCAPTRLYFHHYRQVNNFLDQLALRVARFIQKKGYAALPVPASQIVDWQKQSAHLSHKQLGVLAGLGWIGRSNLLVNKDLGAQFRLVTILTNMPLKANAPVKENCQECFLCVKICPAQAIHGNVQGFEHQKCFEKLKEFQKQRLVDQFICGVCVNICKGKAQA